MAGIFLDIYGYKISISYSHEKQSLIETKIREDFFFFLKENSIDSNLAISINLSPLVLDKKGFYLGKTRMARVYALSFKERLYKYRSLHNSADLKVLFDKQVRAEIYSEDVNLVYEVLYILILALSGEYLDACGLMRLHAAGVRSAGNSTIFWGLRGSGKSTLFTYLCQEPVEAFYSDEICILDLSREKLMPFPVRIALNEDLLSKIKLPFKLSELQRTFLDKKNTYPFPKERIAPEEALKHFIFLGKLSGKNELSKIKWPLKCRLFLSILLGIGLIQMLEFILRVNNTKTLLKIFFNRMRLILVLNQYSLSYWKRSGILETDIAFIKNFLRGSSQK